MKQFLIELLYVETDPEPVNLLVNCKENIQRIVPKMALLIYCKTVALCATTNLKYSLLTLSGEEKLLATRMEMSNCLW